MSCFRCFSGSRTKRGKGEKRLEGSTAPTSPAAASFLSTVSTGAPSNLTFSTASSAVVTSHSEDSSAVMRPEATKSSGSASVSSARSIPELYEERGASSLREFGFRELRAATSDFSRLLKVGEGGFGSVYKGVVRLPGGPAGGTVVAIKNSIPMVIRSSRLSHSGISHLPADEVKPLVKYDNDEDAHSPGGRGRGRGGRGRGRGRGRGGRGNGFNEYADAGWEDDHAPAYMGNGYARGRGRSFRGRGRRGGDNNQPEYQQVGGYYEEAPVHAPALGG
uniref:Protein kinase superfamily protein n=1 Tax=Zea mays TaxID=4577 RepID=A0A804UC57_MAIZE